MTEEKRNPDAEPAQDAPNETDSTETSSDDGIELAEPAAAGETSPKEDETAALRDRLLRALAENENLLRRARRDREETAKYAASNFARDVLSVADNLSRALDAVPASVRESDDARAFLDGVELTARELAATLERHGIKRISPLGERFNHDLHEALFEVPTADAEPGTVVQVVQDGYTIHDRLLRAARVGVARALPEGSGADDDGNGDGHAIDTTA